MHPVNWRNSQLKASDVWAWAKEELAKAREKNDDNSKTLEETNALRGRIGLLKEMLALPQIQATLAEINDPQ